MKRIPLLAKITILTLEILKYLDDFLIWDSILSLLAFNSTTILTSYWTLELCLCIYRRASGSLLNSVKITSPRGRRNIPTKIFSNKLSYRENIVAKISATQVDFSIFYEFLNSPLLLLVYQKLNSSFRPRLMNPFKIRDLSVLAPPLYRIRSDIASKFWFFFNNQYNNEFGRYRGFYGITS